MWEKLQKAAQHPAVQMLQKLCGDPVQLYSILLIASGMSYYHSSMTWLYTFLAVFLTLILMKFYDFVAKHKWIGPPCYLAFLMAGLGIVSVITEIGWQDYPITFFVWFLTPQSVVEFSGWYTVAMYLLMTGFISSAVYYFAKVRYRMVMQFLIMLIPLSLYAKEGIQMSAPLVILLLASYFLLMIYCRQLRETKEIRRLHGLHGKVSIAAFVMSFSILAAIFPKPNIQADRTFIENAMSFSSWSDILMEAISMFTDTTDNTAMLSTNGRTLYYLNADESLRLRTQTYTYYDENDAWHKDNDYDYPEYWYSDVTFRKPQDVLQAILDAAGQDADFAETYGLTDAAGKTLPEQKKQYLTVVNFLSGTNMIPTPTRIGSLNETRRPETMVSEHGALTPSERTYSMLDTFYLTYYSDTYARFEQVQNVLQQIRQDTYAQLLADAALILKEAGDTEAAALLTATAEEQQDAMAYLAHTQMLDYDSAVVDALAAELTQGLSSDLEKALAIERYFENADYVYDLAYQKEKGDNVDDFLQTSHTGVCYEYATAMVLLCRSAGLPARYTQGYSASDMVDAYINGIELNYVIKARDAHGFPEVYISGYGWVSFEPTVAAEETEDGMAENRYVMIWGGILFLLSLLAVGVYLLLPKIKESLFRRRTARLDAGEAASAVFRRMRMLLKLPESTTVQELSEQSAVFTKETALFHAMDTHLYDNAPEQIPMPTADMLHAYIAWHDARTAYLKAEKQKEKLERKQKRSAKK